MAAGGSFLALHGTYEKHSGLSSFRVIPAAIPDCPAFTWKGLPHPFGVWRTRRRQFG
jgi:hypothetical protein